MDDRMDAPNGCRIVELLRKAAMGSYEGSKGKVMDNLAQLIGCDGHMHFHTIDKLADMVEEAIQREHESAYDAGYDEGLASADDWCAQHEDAMNEHGWVRLPKDADGEYIHLGDVMEWCDSGDTLEVVGIGADDTLFYFDKDSDSEEMADWTSARNKRHHHKQPTVEDVLREFAEKMNENMGMYTGEVIDADEWRDADRKTIAEYAAKLREMMAGDAE